MRLTRLKNLEEVSLDKQDSEDSTAVYFDLLGIVMVSYPALLGVLITLAMVSLVSFSLHHDMRRFEKKHDFMPGDSMKTIISILISIFLILVTSVVTTASYLSLQSPKVANEKHKERKHFPQLDQ